jgi:hypothetical protein
LGILSQGADAAVVINVPPPPTVESRHARGPRRTANLLGIVSSTEFLNYRVSIYGRSRGQRNISRAMITGESSFAVGAIMADGDALNW